MASWDTPAASTAGSWDSFLQSSPFGGSSSWWTTGGPPQRFTYDQRLSAGQGLSYEPAYGSATIYQPYSGFTQNIIDTNIDNWLRTAHPELFQFNIDQGGQLTNAGRVGSLPGFGKFDAAADADIQAAAQQTGVPVNFLKSIVNRESSGDWAANSHWVASVRGGKRIYGYVGVFEDAAKQWGFDFDSLNNNRAGQVLMLATGLRKMYDSIKAQDPKATWINVAAEHFSGDPNPNNGYVDELGNTTTGYVANIQQWWQDLDKSAGNQFSVNGPVGQNVGTVHSPNGPDWQRVNQWDQAIQAASQQYGVPPDLIKAVMRIESGGDPTAVSPAGALGLMQVMPDGGWGGQPIDTKRALSDPAYNIMMGAKELRAAYDAQNHDWDMAIRAYHGFGSDGFTTDQDYLAKVKSFEGELGTGLSYGAPASPTATSQIDTIWGGIPGVGVTQELGPTDFSMGAGASYYGASPSLGIQGHMGVDYGMDPGTKLYSPISGTVEIAGGTQWYTDSRYVDNQGVSWPYTGQLQVRADNGDILILGHMGQISVKVGDRLSPGMYVGLSGTNNGGHVHVEWRTPSTTTSSGWQVVDPRKVLNGSYAGVYQQGVIGAGIDRPMTFQDLMMAGATGAPIRMGATMSSGSGWHDFLLAAMQGKIAPVAPGAPGYKRTGTYTPSAYRGTGTSTTGATP